MKRFLPNLLVFFSLALCALSAFQWVRETHLRAVVAKRDEALFQKATEVQNLEGLVKTIQAEIGRLDSLKTQLTESLQTNRQEIANLKRELEKSESEIEKNLKQIDQYKKALDEANASIKKQNEEIKKQNLEMIQLAGDRNESVAKYNKVVEQYHDLVKEFTKYQEDVSKALGEKQPGGKPPAEKTSK